jgi:hypothetical protein
VIQQFDGRGNLYAHKYILGKKRNSGKNLNHFCQYFLFFKWIAVTFLIQHGMIVSQRRAQKNVPISFLEKSDKLK